MNALTTNWEKFEKSNSTHDLARWLLEQEDSQLIRLDVMFYDGVSFKLDSRKHKVYLAAKKLASMDKD